MLIVEYNTKMIKERSNSMRLSFKTVNKTLIASIVGEIDHHTSEDIMEKIDRHLENESLINLILDLSGVNFMDSAGIGVILGRYKRIAHFNGKLAIVAKKPNIIRILTISGIHKIAKLFDNTDKALLYM